MASILVVDDEANIRRALSALLRAEGHTVREAATGIAAVAEVRAQEPDAVLMDLYMPERNGLDTLPELRELAPSLPVVMMSGRASLADAVEATRRGAFHFIEKPLTPEAVLLTLASALELRQARELNRALREDLGGEEEMVGRSSGIEAVRTLIARVAPTEARVLITGESGVGKELVASAVHRGSRRAGGPLLRLNCAAIPRDLVESELFGHERGAFTGAHEKRRGRFELASGGTLFLDEIGDLGPEAQAKLLRAIESGEIERLGGNQPIPVDVRIVSATNKDLRAEVAAGRFREDLFFRLHVVPVHVPPLRERAEDVPLLVRTFLDRHHRRTGMRPPMLAPAALDALAAHSWPGNVRELINLLERLAIVHAGESVGAAQLRALLAGSGGNGRPSPAAAPGALNELLDAYEKSLIEAALGRAGGSVAEAARQLHTDRANLYRRMKRLGVER